MSLHSFPLWWAAEINHIESCCRQLEPDSPGGRKLCKASMEPKTAPDAERKKFQKLGAEIVTDFVGGIIAGLLRLFLVANVVRACDVVVGSKLVVCCALLHATAYDICLRFTQSQSDHIGTTSSRGLLTCGGLVAATITTCAVPDAAFHQLSTLVCG